MHSGILYIVASPIGNLSDFSYRAIETLTECNIIACEDTRVSRKLLSHYAIRDKKIISYANHNLEKQTANIIELLKNNNKVALLSDAGTPLISDPGSLLVNSCYREQLKVVHIPGSCSVITALVTSGLPAYNFYFGGFLENKQGAKITQLMSLKQLRSTLIFFETKHRIIKSLESIKLVFGGKCSVVLARELTKFYEEIKQGTPDELITQLQKSAILGEFVLLIDNNKVLHEVSINSEELKQQIIKELKISTVKDISSVFAKKYNLPKNEIYQLVLNLKNEHK